MKRLTNQCAGLVDLVCHIVLFFLTACSFTRGATECGRCGAQCPTYVHSVVLLAAEYKNYPRPSVNIAHSDTSCTG
jgi:hypothetical protein